MAWLRLGDNLAFEQRENPPQIIAILGERNLGRERQAGVRRESRAGSREDSATGIREQGAARIRSGSKSTAWDAASTSLGER